MSTTADNSKKFRRLRPRNSVTKVQRTLREAREWTAFLTLAFAAFSSILISVAIVWVLFSESSAFFTDKRVSLLAFFTDTEWAPKFDNNPRFGILPLVTATVMTSCIALVVALPMGTIVAVYLSEFAPPLVREFIKPTLELLSAVPTVIYGYFALTFVSPLMQWVIPGLPRSNMLSAGLVMGIMIIPYVSSLSEDAIRSVPMLLREGSYALGGNRFITAFRVVIPSAISGIGAAYILGISRAIGETMIVAIAGGLQPDFTLNPTRQAQTITSYIVEATKGDAARDGLGYKSIFAAGLVLFAMTLTFNLLGFWLRRRFHRAY